MLDHLSIGVSDLKQSSAFYDALFLPLGYCRVWNGDTAIGYGKEGQEEPFAIKQDVQKLPLCLSPRSHIAFSAKTRDTVIASYDAAMEKGGVDLGKPGLRPNYGENYFAAFVGDPDGYRIEIVCHVAR